MIQHFYPMGLERKDGALLPSDLPEAINLFKQNYGVDPVKVVVSQKMFKHFENIMPEGLELEVWGGCLKWEIGIIGGAFKESPAKGAGDTLLNRDETRQNTRLTPCKPLHGKTDTALVLHHKVTHEKGQISKSKPEVVAKSVPKLQELKVKVVLSLPTKGIIPTASDKTPDPERKGVMKHAGGRPRKVAGYSTRTKYRRQKEGQGVLL